MSAALNLSRMDGMRNTQGGFSLIELLVALVIGLFLLMGLSTYFVQNKQTYTYQQAQANQQEHERIFAMMLGRGIRQAGYAPMNTNRLTGQEVVFPGNGGNFGAGQFVFGTEGTHNVTVNGMAAAQAFPDDTLSVRYLGDASLARCDGTNSVAAADSIDTFSTDGVTFSCTTDGAVTTGLFGVASVPLTQQFRVLGMAVTYGLDTDDDGAVDTLSRAGAVGDWTQARSAQIEIHFQAGERPPQANNFLFVLENSLGVDRL